ncbi:trehalose-6-phosphate synthase [Enterococcus durans]|nr:trehalose-6-phosphate synthase [Enterococcus durans]MBX9078593.1 trehalose-6-phosphate synthase [Enterococcus durans]
MGQKCLIPRNKKKFTKIAFQIFVNFGLFKKELLLLPSFIREPIARLIFRFVHSPFVYL